MSHHILLVEDNPTDAFIVRAALEDQAEPFELHHVDRLSGALKFLSERRCDLILADLSLPDAQGLATVERLCGAAPEIPLVVLTGLEDTSVALQAVRKGAQDYVSKGSIEPDLLARVMRHAIERMRSQRRLRESEERFRELAENIQQAFWMSRADRSELLYLSPAYEKIWGVPVDQAVRDPLSDLDRIHPEDREAAQALLKDNPQGPYRHTYRILRADGETRWIRERAFPVRDSAGQVVHVVGTSEDITEQHMLEEQLRQAQKMESIGRLAGGVAHDFNNLLTAILGYSGLVLGALEDENPLREDLEEIERAGLRARELTRQLLTFSRKQILQPRTMNLNQAIRDLERMLRRLIGSDIEMDIELLAGRATLFADPGQVQQVLLNLAINARDAMPTGGRLSIRTEQGPEGCVRIVVEDTGHGMAPETLSRIFEPFFSTKAEAGTGLGLSTVFGIVEQSGGRISAESQVGEGTRFLIDLPLCDAPETNEEASGADPRGGSETVLLVDDEAMVRRFAQRTLEKSGYRVLTAGSAREAMGVASSSPTPIHLLLTDVVMPRQSGVELARTLMDAIPHLRVLVMSGYTEEKAQLRKLGPEVPFLQKPFNTRELLQAVRRVLDAEPQRPSTITRSSSV